MSHARKLHNIELWLLLLAGLIGVPCFLLSAPGRDFLAEVLQGWMWLGAQFRVVNTSTPLIRVLLPAIIFGTFTMA